MAKPQLILNQLTQVQANGSALAGGQLFVYQPGTTTKLTLYTSSSLGTTQANPIVLSSGTDAGRVPQDVYVTQSYKLVLTSSTDTDPPTSPIATGDNISLLAQTVSTISKSTDYTILVTDRDKLILVDATTGNKTITLLASASAGDGFQLSVKKIDSGSNTVTIQANGAETIDGNNTSILHTKNETLNLTNSAGTTWYTTKTTPQSFNDTNGNTILAFTTTASAVNYVNITDAATTNPPAITSTGSDTNVGLNITSKGNGTITLTSSNGTITLAASTVNLSATTGSLNSHLLITKVNVQVFTSSGTYTPTSGMQYCTMELVGGGGGGGGTVGGGGSRISVSGGGGGGGYTRKTVTAATIGVSQTVTIGAAGTAGTTAGSDGGGGGTTSVGVICSATGGSGGGGNTGDFAAGVTSGGGGGAGSSGDFNINGSAGGSAYGSGIIGFTGFGGNSYFSGSSLGITVNGGHSTGTTGLNYGGGGSGGGSSNASGASAGGAGAAGLVIITEYISA